MLLPLHRLIVFTGVYPKPLLDRIEPSVDRADRARRGQDATTSPTPDVADEPDEGRRRWTCRLQRRRRSSGPTSTGSRCRRCSSCVGGGAGPARRRRADAAVAARAATRWSPPRRPVAAGVLAMVLWDDITDDGPTTLVGGALALRHVRACSSRSRSAPRVVLVALITDDYLRREGLDGPEVYALFLVAATGGVVMGVGQRPDRAVPRARDAVARASTCSPPATAARIAEPGERASSTSCSAASRRRSSSTASPSSTAPPASTNISEIVAAFRRHVPGRPQRRARARRRRAAARRPRVQGRRRAVPRLDARRVPGRADAGHGVHGVGRQGRPRSPRCCGCSSSRCRSTATTGGRSIWVLAVLSLVVGSVLAVVQTDVKRMLAYSSISHAGFILVGVEAAGAPRRRGRQRRSACRASLVYLLPTPCSSSARSPSSPSSPAAATATPTSTRSAASARSRPVLALALTVFLSPRPACRSRAASSPSSA